ncbi:unnamed protein product, partial [Sphacelaria rigidula]
TECSLGTRLHTFEAVTVPHPTSWPRQKRTYKRFRGQHHEQLQINVHRVRSLEPYNGLKASRALPSIVRVLPPLHAMPAHPPNTVWWRQLRNGMMHPISTQLRQFLLGCPQCWCVRW